jgi:hypothetical protein
MKIFVPNQARKMTLSKEVFFRFPHIRIRTPNTVWFALHLQNPTPTQVLWFSQTIEKHLPRENNNLEGA